MSEPRIPCAPHRRDSTARTREAIRRRLRELDVEYGALLDALPSAPPAALARMDPPKAPGRPRTVFFDEADRAAWWSGDLTAAEYARQLEISPQRASQIIQRDTHRWERALVKRRARARTNLRRAAAAGRVVLTCPLCGHVFEKRRGARRFCSQDHARRFHGLVRHLNADRRARHAVLVARWRYRGNPTSSNLANLERAKARTQKSQGRWLIKGSMNWDTCQQAYRQRWPIFDDLPAQIQAQVSRDAA